MKQDFVESVPISEFNKVRNMQIIMSFAMNEVVQQVHLECIERANVIKILWQTIINEFERLSDVYSSEHEKKNQYMNTKIKVYSDNYDNAIHKCKELETKIKIMQEKEESKERIYQQLVEDNQSLRYRLSKISEVFDSIMVKKTDKIKDEIEKKKESLLKSIYDVPKDDLLTLTDIFSPRDNEELSTQINNILEAKLGKRAEASSQTDPDIGRSRVPDLLIKKRLSVESGGNESAERIETNRPHEELNLAQIPNTDRAEGYSISYNEAPPLYDVGVNVRMPLESISEYYEDGHNALDILPAKLIGTVVNAKEKYNKMIILSKPTEKPKEKKILKKGVTGQIKTKRKFSRPIKTNKHSAKDGNSPLQHESSMNFSSKTKELMDAKNNILSINQKISRKKRIGGSISSILKGLLDSNHLEVIKERICEEVDEEFCQKKIGPTTNSKKPVFNREYSSLLKKESDDEFEADSSFFKMDEVATELPHKLLAVMDKLSNKITNLNVNEYGDYVLDPSSNDPLLDKVKSNAHALSHLLNNFYDERKKKDSKTVQIADSQTQTEEFYMAPTDSNNNRPKSQGQKCKQSVTPLKGVQKPPPFKRQNTITKVTESQPFKFIHFKHRAKVHPVYGIINDILSTRNKKVNNRSLMPIKTLVKNIMIFYNEKIISSKDNVYFKNQRLSEFIYNSLYHRYGLQQVAERKFQEVCVAAFHTHATEARISNFAKFMGLTEPAYSTDDLNFYFLMNQFYLQACIDSSIALKKETLFSFDVPSFSKVKNYIEIINRYFAQKVPPLKIQIIIGRLHNLVRKEDEEMKKNISSAELEERVTHVDVFMSMCIDAYREIKLEFQDILKKKKIITRCISIEEDIYSKEELFEIAKAVGLNTLFNDNDIENFFLKNAQFTNDGGSPDKKIQLEKILSFLINNNINLEQ